jgi:crossover junction endodeoxyribonuclease RuvC
MTPYEYVIGFDPSLTCSGLAIWSLDDYAGERVSSTTIPVPTIPHATLREDGYRIARMVKTATTAIDALVYRRRSLALFEGPIPHMRNAGKQHERAGVFWGVATHLLGFADIARVPPSVLKKYWTGNGNADKPRMVEAVGNHWSGRLVRTDDEADALALAHMGVRAILGPSPWFYPTDTTLLRKVDWPAGFKMKGD